MPRDARLKLNYSNLLSKDIAIDLGTANTLIWVKGRGIMINEPSIVARMVNSDKIVAVGIEAQDMLGKTHHNLETIRPLKDGVIADFQMADEMIQGFVRKMHLSRIARPRMVICIPSGVTPVEQRAVRESAERANAREVHLIEEPVAAAIGIGLDIAKPVGNMIVDIGGGTTEIAIIALNGVVAMEAIRVAGDEMDAAIVDWFHNEHKMEVGYRTAERIKCSVGAGISAGNSRILVKGRDLVSGIPKTISVSADEIRKALSDTLFQIISAMKRALERTPPELSSDILDRGIVLTGGGSMLKGLDEIFREETNLPVHVAEEPLTSVVMGTGMALENIKTYAAVLF
ncbi:MAG: rod shape-determining protein [Fidelibacterota bacterium]|nr:MAG: rod shape-determining protein [Candidatus Neomarinimicrobiota bacterium]